MKLGEAKKKLEKGEEVSSGGYGLMFKLGSPEEDEEQEVDAESPMSILNYLKKLGCPKKKKVEVEFEPGD